MRATAARQLGQIAAVRVRGSSSSSAATVAAAAAATAPAPKADVSAADSSAKDSPASSASAAPYTSARGETGSPQYHGIDGDWDQAIFLLARILPHLRSKTWDSRVAAAQAIEAVCSASGVWDPESLLGKRHHDGEDVRSSDASTSTNALRPSSTTSNTSQSTASDSHMLSFDTFSLSHILSTGQKLLSSAGSEYDLPANSSVEERLAHAKRDMQRLGLASMAGEDVDLGVDVEHELMSDVPGSASRSSTAPNSAAAAPSSPASSAATAASAPKHLAPPPTPLQRIATPVSRSPPASPLAASQQTSDMPSTPGGAEEVDLSKLSARERNQLKRKRKLEGKGGAGGASSAGPPEKTRAVEVSPDVAFHSTPGAMVKSPDAQMPNPTIAAPAAETDRNEHAALGTTNGAVSPGIAPQSPNDVSLARGGDSASARSDDAASLIPSPGEWPFTLICALLLSDLFSPTWEVRHGAALGLRELFKAQGSGGGKIIGAPRRSAVRVKKEDEEDEGVTSKASAADNETRHKVWCNDAAIRLLCVLTLDRLGDFVFDQVIAPVRETVGQALSSLLRWMDATSVAQVHGVLVDMVTQSFLVGSKGGSDSKELHTALQQYSLDGTLSSLQARRGVAGYAWEVRHAGLLGLRYEVSIRSELLVRPNGKGASTYLYDVVNLAIVCLRDDDDDVRSVAAATLLPIVDHVVDLVPEAIGAILHQLWESLFHLKDDLSSSTGGVMDLLATLVERPAVVAHLAGIKTEHADGESVTDLIPRLFPFFRHTITSVRLAVLNALSTFLSVPSLPKDWAGDKLVRLLFQNLVVEERPTIREASRTTWQRALEVVMATGQLVETVQPHLRAFFTILMTPLGTPLDFGLFYRASAGIAARETHNVDKGILAQDLALVGVDAVIRGRLGAAQALGSIMAHWPGGADEATFNELLLGNLTSSSALQKCLGCIVVQEWAERTWPASGSSSSDLAHTNLLAKEVSIRLIDILESPAPSTYAEMVIMLQRIQRQSQALYTSFARDGKVKRDYVPELPSAVDAAGQLKDAFTITTAKSVVGSGYEGLMARVAVRSKATAMPILEDRRAKLIADIGFYQSIKDKQDSQVAASAAAATIALRSLPAKLNPVIRSVMNSIKFEENADLQLCSARAIASLLDLCRQPGARANPSDKIVKNLCAFVCQDTTQTPIFDKTKSHLDGVLSLIEAKAVADTQAASTAGSGRGRGRFAAGGGSMDSGGVVNDANLSLEEREGRLIRRGAEKSLQAIAERFAGSLFEAVPTLWQCWTATLFAVFGDESAPVTSGEVDESSGQGVIDCCTLLQANIANLDPELTARTVGLLPTLSRAIQSRYSVIRAMAAETLAAMAYSHTAPVMLFIVESIVPLLGDASSIANRQGSIETISHVVRRLDLKLLPYVIVLIVPVLGRMSDPDESVRLTATNTFASLVKMVPLEAGLPDPPGFPERLMTKRQNERQFLSQLLDGSKVEQYDLPVEIKAELRKYQRDGVSWMAFLAKFQLHGILCDDMGLGKTLQSICVLSSKHFERAQRFKATQAPDAKALPSLVICPPTLTGHWCHEIRQYATNLQPLLYAGLPNERARLQSMIPRYDCIVVSYDTVRNDIAALSKYDWLYCILDEGHIIKSAKTKTTKAVKMIRAQHRLVLSGTPIQNNVLELWSLFDFLMPGFLGTEKMFIDRYARPILASRDAKVSAREHERASLALDALHKQVLPFLLRRMKEDVLSDLPPKIIQDISCDMSDIQRQLYEDYLRGQNPEGFEDALAQGENVEQKQHVFQTLQWLRKLVCHPLLVLDAQRPRHREIQQALVKSGRTLNDVANAPKLLALKQLLQDCGIGTSSAGGASASSAAAGGAGGAGLDDLAADDGGISQHRVLIFCQQRQMLDIIEKDLLQRAMPSVTYARLDGSVASAEKRFAIVQRFNSDPSIDVLLLTTAVGGLGLTLTGADTVIFVEHDWNPMKDMQAMDRAHRLGQKKVVNVYRLITRDTLEEKIMGLQRFKLNVAGNIVNEQNKATDSMDTDQILDLFDNTGGDSQTSTDGAHGGASSNNAVAAAAARSGKRGGVSQRALLAGLESMEDTGDDYAQMQRWSG